MKSEAVDIKPSGLSDIVSQVFLLRNLISLLSSLLMVLWRLILHAQKLVN